MKKVLALILASAMACMLLGGCGKTTTGNAPVKTSEAAGENGKTGEGTGKAGGESAAADDNKTNAEKLKESAISKSAADDDAVNIRHEKPIQVTVALSNSVSAYSPIMVVNPYNNIVASGVYERLAEREQYGSSEFKGVMLKNWEAFNDNYSYHCELYDYIVDSADNKLTAQDVAYSVKLQAEEAGKSQAKKVASVDVTGDYTFDITFTQNNEGFFTEFCENTWIFTQAAYEKSVAENSICAGTGPYKCTEFMANSYIVVEKRDGYWQTDELRALTSRANVDRIRYNIVSEVTQMGIAIDSPDDTQICGYVVESLVDDAMNSAAGNGVEVLGIESTQTKILVFNATENSLLANEDLRKAICYALNNQICINTTYSGIGFIPATLGIPQLKDYNEAWEEEDYYSYNMEKAKEHLKAAGYNPDNAGISLKFYGVSNSQNVNNGAFIAGCLAELGISVETVTVEAAASNAARNDMAIGWDMFEGGGTPNAVTNYLYYADYGDQVSHGGHAYWGPVDDELQALVNRVKAGDAEAWETYRRMLIDECYLYQYAGCYYVVTHVNTITNIVTDYRNSLCIGACTYSEDYPYFVE